MIDIEELNRLIEESRELYNIKSRWIPEIDEWCYVIDDTIKGDFCANNSKLKTGDLFKVSDFNYLKEKWLYGEDNYWLFYDLKDNAITLESVRKATKEEIIIHYRDKLGIHIFDLKNNR